MQKEGLKFQASKGSFERKMRNLLTLMFIIIDKNRPETDNEFKRECNGGKIILYLAYLFSCVGCKRHLFSLN